MALYNVATDIIRQRIARHVGDCILATVTSSSDTAIVLATTDPPTFYGEDDDYFNNYKYQVYCYKGTNIGTSNRAKDWVNSTHTLTVEPGAAASYTTSSKLELHCIFTVQEIMDAINLTIDDAVGMYIIKVDDSTTITLVEGETNDGDTIYTYEYALPTNLLFLNTVTTEGYETGTKLTGTVSGAFTLGETVTGSSSEATGILSFGPSGGTYILLREVSGTFTTSDTATGGTSEKTCSSITAVANEDVGDGKFEDADEVDPRDYSILGAYPPKIKFHEDHYNVVGDLRIRLEGHGSQDAVTADTDAIYLPTDWVVWRAITHLPMSKLESGSLLNTFKLAMDNSRDVPFVAHHPNAKQVCE